MNLVIEERRFEKTIVTSNFTRIALRCENPGLCSSKNWLSKTKFDLLKLDESNPCFPVMPQTPPAHKMPGVVAATPGIGCR
jgi:hypothetical protein